MLHFSCIDYEEDTQSGRVLSGYKHQKQYFHNFGILITIHLLENGKQTSFNLKDSAKSAWGLNPKRFSSMRFTSCIFYLIRKSGYRRRSLKEVHQVQRSTMCTKKVTDKRTLRVRRQ